MRNWSFSEAIQREMLRSGSRSEELKGILINSMIMCSSCWIQFGSEGGGHFDLDFTAIDEVESEHSSAWSYYAWHNKRWISMYSASDTASNSYTG